MRITEVYLWPILQVCLQTYDNRCCDMFNSKAKYTGLHFTTEHTLVHIRGTNSLHKLLANYYHNFSIQFFAHLLLILVLLHKIVLRIYFRNMNCKNGFL